MSAGLDGPDGATVSSAGFACPCGAGLGGACATAAEDDSRAALRSTAVDTRIIARLLFPDGSTSRNGAQATATDSWATGADGLGPDGPQCVVCQSAPRTVIVWPCRCLSLCDDCRVSLAMNNFDKCVCCRREVISFSRIFVP